MKTFSNNMIRVFGNVFSAFLVLVIAFVFVSTAYAADLDFGGDTWGDYYPVDTGYSGDTWGDYYPTESSYGGETWGDYYPTESGFSDYGGSSSGWSFGGGGFSSGGGWTMPTRSSGGMSQYQSLSNTNVNENYCTNGSCNTSSSVNAPTNIINNPTPSYPVYQPTYPVYTQPAPVYTQPTYYPAQQRTVAYNSAPYVSLAAVPYTGFELGPVGTALYWGFLVLWCLLAAYLIVVKKIQNKIAAWFTDSTAAKRAPSGHANFSAEKSAEMLAPSRSQLPPVAVLPAFKGIDPFILSQINRA